MPCLLPLTKFKSSLKVILWTFRYVYPSLPGIIIKMKAPMLNSTTLISHLSGSFVRSGSLLPLLGTRSKNTRSIYFSSSEEFVLLSSKYV